MTDKDMVVALEKAKKMINDDEGDFAQHMTYIYAATLFLDQVISELKMRQMVKKGV